MSGCNEGWSSSQLATMLTNPALACVPCTSSCDDNTLPPILVTAPATRCSSAAPATVTVAPSRKAEPDGIPAGPDRAPGAGAFRPSNCSSMAADAFTVACWLNISATELKVVANRTQTRPAYKVV